MALTTPFAQNGDKKAIPQNTSDGSVSFDRGFGSFYALPPEEGGLFIDRAQFNQLMFDTTSQVLENKQQIATQANRINEVNANLTNSINTKANQATTYNKTEVNNLLNAKANSNAVVALTGNQTINGVKTFSSPPISATNPTANNQVANKAYVDRVANTKANANATVNLTGNQNIAGVKTFSSPIVVPNGTANNHAVNLSQLNTKANQATTYNKSEVDAKVNSKIDSTKATKLLTANLVKTVGARGADFANLRQALEWASQYSYSGGRFTITLNCNADMPIPGIYLPIGEAIIIIDGQNNTFNCDSAYFMATDSSAQNITIKNFILNYNGITSNYYGCAFQFTNTSVLLKNITINITNSNISGVLIVNQGGYLNMFKTTINCSGNSNIQTLLFNNNGNLNSQDLVVNTTSLSGQINILFSFNGGSGNLYQYNTEKPVYPTDKIVTQINVYGGSTVFCGNRFNDSKLSIAPNTLTSAGIIFKV